jgi:hypothetical protein
MSVNNKVMFPKALEQSSEIKSDKISENTGSNGVEIADYPKFSAGPLFVVTNSVDLDDVTGNNTAYTVLFDTEAIDTGAGYAPATGKFTAPVTGIYEFIVNMTVHDITDAASTFNLALVVEVASTGTHVVFDAIVGAIDVGATKTLTISCKKTLALTATATVKVVLTINMPVTLSDDCDITAASQFSGRLITIT